MEEKGQKSYPSDLTDKQWEEMAALYEEMCNSTWSKRELTDAVLYLVDSGCKWRQLPHDFPPYSTVHSFYRRARISGLWDKILKHLVKKTRTNAGRKESPSYAIIDSQSVKTVVAVVVHATNIHDTKGGISTAKRAYEQYSSIQKFCADAGYRGTFVSDLKEQLDLDVDISEKIKPHQWEKLPWRWVVERTLPWFNHSRRLSKDFEISVSSAEAMV